MSNSGVHVSAAVIGGAKITVWPERLAPGNAANAPNMEATFALSAPSDPTPFGFTFCT